MIAGLVGACTEPATPTPTPSTPTPAPSSPGPSAPAPTPTPTAAPTPATPEPEPEVIELICNTSTPVVAPPAHAFQDWADEITLRTNGRVKFTIYFSGGLFEQREVIRSVMEGVGDMSSSYTPVEDPGLMVLNLFTDLPFLNWPTDPYDATEAYRELYNRVPEMTAEFQGLKVMFPVMYSSMNYFNCTTKLVQTSDDLKGMKLMAQGYSGVWAEKMGATPVVLSWPEMYTSMEKGIVEASIGGYGAPIANGQIELYKYATNIHALMRAGIDMCVMNPDSWANLPPDIQKIFDDSVPFFNEKRIGYEAEMDNIGLGILQEQGCEFGDLDPAVLQEWRDVAAEVSAEWIAESEAKGKAAQKLYDTMNEIFSEYQ